VVPDAPRRREYQKASADFTQNGRKLNRRSCGVDRLWAPSGAFSWG
jgi:hypothetical protein